MSSCIAAGGAGVLDLCPLLGNDKGVSQTARISSQRSARQVLAREAALFFGLLFIGFVIVPIVLFVVGQRVFGEFGGHGYSDFFGTLSGKIRAGQPVAWFFVLSPYLVWQTLRLTVTGWRRTSRSAD